MRSVLVLAVLLALAGCSGSDAPDAGPADSGAVDCANDARVQPFAPGATVGDEAGDRAYVIVQGDPSSPVRGTNTWTVEVKDGSGAALPGLQLDAAAFMPDHGHGSDVVPQVTALGGGSYSVTPLYFFMPGVWRVTLSDADGGGEAGQFFFCIEG